MDTPPTHTTARLLMRAPTEADLPAWTERIFADPQVTRYIPSFIPEPHERARRTLAAVSASWAQHGYGTWLLIDRDDGQLVGHCGLGYLPASAEVEIDYALAPPYWGRGLAVEAGRVTLAHAFGPVGLATVIGLAVPENSPSRRVLAKLGFRYYGEAPYFGMRLAYHTIVAEATAAHH